MYIKLALNPVGDRREGEACFFDFRFKSRVSVLTVSEKAGSLAHFRRILRSEETLARVPLQAVAFSPSIPSFLPSRAIQSSPLDSRSICMNGRYFPFLFPARPSPDPRVGRRGLDYNFRLSSWPWVIACLRGRGTKDTGLGFAMQEWIFDRVE